MTDKERFLSELKLLCNKYAVTLGHARHHRNVFGELLLSHCSPVFVSGEFVLELETEVYNYLNDLDPDTEILKLIMKDSND
jgi:hypothetical protein